MNYDFSILYGLVTIICALIATIGRIIYSQFNSFKTSTNLSLNNLHKKVEEIRMSFEDRLSEEKAYLLNLVDSVNKYTTNIKDNTTEFKSLVDVLNVKIQSELEQIKKELASIDLSIEKSQKKAEQLEMKIDEAYNASMKLTQIMASHHKSIEENKNNILSINKKFDLILSGKKSKPQRKAQ